MSTFRKSGQKAHISRTSFLLQSTAVTPDIHIRNFCPQAPQYVIESSSQKGHSSCHKSRHPGMLTRNFLPTAPRSPTRNFALLRVTNKDLGWRSIKRYSVSTIVARSSKGEILLTGQLLSNQSFLTVYLTATIRDRGTSYHMALSPSRLKGARHQGSDIGGLLR